MSNGSAVEPRPRLKLKYDADYVIKGVSAVIGRTG